jgi:alpha-tubulin suppressor-like RCC1 family protein
MNGRLSNGDSDTSDGKPASELGFVEIADDASVVQIAAGTSHTCALLESHDLVCWGDGGWWQLGYGSDRDVGDDEVPRQAGRVPL